MKIAIGSDHAGYEYKEIMKEHIESAGHSILDMGTSVPKSCDYPDFAFAVAEAVAAGDADYGILLCGTGIGMSMAANKVQGIRAALCCSALMARLSREHNNANVLCMGARITGIEMAREMVNSFLSTRFAGDRHEKRLAKIGEKENATR